MSIHYLIITLGIFILAACGFIFLSTMLVMNSRRMETIKGAPFRMFDEGLASDHVEHRTDCFESCIAKYAWDVDQTAYCTTYCKSSLKPETPTRSSRFHMRHVQVLHGPLPEFAAR